MPGELRGLIALPSEGYSRQRATSGSGHCCLRLPAGSLASLALPMSLTWGQKKKAIWPATAREKPKNRIRGLLIEGDPGTWPSFLRTIPNFPEFLQALRDLFRVFVAVHRNFPEFLLIRRASSAKSPKNPPNYQEFLSPSRFNPRFCWFSPAKTPDKSKSFVKISEKNQLFWISMLSSFSKQPLCPI